jgi:hypothetical protein
MWCGNEVRSRVTSRFSPSGLQRLHGPRLFNDFWTTAHAARQLRSEIERAQGLRFSELPPIMILAYIVDMRNHL